MLYHVCFAADEHEPYPPLAEMQTVEAKTPLAAVDALSHAGLVPSERPISWARVVVAAVDGQPMQVVHYRVPIDAGALPGWQLAYSTGVRRKSYSATQLVAIAAVGLAFLAMWWLTNSIAKTTALTLVLLFFGFCYWMLLKSQAFHPWTRNNPRNSSY